MSLQPGGEAWEDRRRLTTAVDHALRRLAQGRTADACETEGVDFKEERGRRGSGGQLLAGQQRNQAVAEQLADEVACLANTAGGGALIVGVSDKGEVVGADTDRDWLRQRIHERVDVAPAIEERHLSDGTRLLVVLVAESREPVPDVNGRLRWRVGKTCQPVDRTEWWSERSRRLGSDPLTRVTDRRIGDVQPTALAAVRRLLRTTATSDVNSLRELPDRELLTRLGVLLPDGRLTAAGVHMFAPAPRTLLELVVLDVPGGDVVSAPPDLAGLSLIEQIAELETRLDALDTAVVLRSGLQLGPIRQVPWLAVREALLNAVVHRDWLPLEPVHITWVQADSSLDVTSPGGFVGGVNAGNVLSSRYSRNPALADLARTLGLVERQGVGVDRMYREMIALGHRPPLIREVPGPRVRTRLVGGAPLAAVVSVMSAIEPPARQRDVRVALTIHAVLRDGFAASRTVAPLLQAPPEEAEETLDVVAQCSINGEPAISHHSADLWLPGKSLVIRASADLAALQAAQRRGLLMWRRPDAQAARDLVRAWLHVSDRITSGDLVRVTSYTYPWALRLLERLTREGLLQRGDADSGRNAHFVAGSAAAIAAGSPAKRT